MGTLRFNVTFKSRGANIPKDIADLLSDLSEPFNNIVKAWAEHNQDKFEAGEGAELTGVSQAAATQWQAVTAGYYREKHGPVKRGNRQLYPDHLMVRTGELMGVMTNPDAFYQNIGARTATFGTPQDPEDMAKVAGNWFKRQVLFLDRQDQRMIQQNISDYLNFGSNYGAQRARLAAYKEEFKSMQVEF